MPSTRAQSVVAVGLAVKPVGKPDAGNPHVRFDERGRETGQLLPRPSSTLQIKGRKRHAMVDMDGRALKLQAHAANIQDRDGAGPLLRASRPSWPFVQLAFADAGYQGPRVTSASSIRVEIVHKPEGQVGFAVHARRWVVERFFAWINRNRRLAKDVEATIASAKAFLYAASAILLLRRLAR